MRGGSTETDQGSTDGERGENHVEDKLVEPQFSYIISRTGWLVKR